MSARILLALTSVLLCLLGAEAVLMLALPQVHRLPETWTHDSTLGWKHEAGSQGRMVTPEFDVAYRIDAAGRRQHELADAHQATKVQLYGDSFAEGWGVEVEDGLASLLQRRLQAPGGVHVENYGTAGFGTDQELLLFSQQGVEQSPDVVLVLFYVNDLWNNVSRRGVGAQRGAKPVFRPRADGSLQLIGTPIPESPPRPPLAMAQRLRQRSHLWALLAKAWSPQAPMPGDQIRHFYGGLYGSDQTEYRSVWKLTELLLAEFAARCRQHGARFVLIYAPAIVQIEADDWRAKRDLHELAGEYDLLNPNRQIRELCARHDIGLIDLTSAFAAAAPSQTLYFRDSHWNEAGHRLAAAEVAAALAQMQVADLTSDVAADRGR